ncbi:UNVERIFIED_CONTAM: hypothetical protein K2H54_038007 [Gekko kuhli]
MISLQVLDTAPENLHDIDSNDYVALETGTPRKFIPMKRDKWTELTLFVTTRDVHELNYEAEFIMNFALFVVYKLKFHDGST